MELKERQRNRFVWALLVAAFTGALLFLGHAKGNTEKLYTDVPCPNCESMSVYCLENDNTPNQELKCADCKITFFISEIE